MSELVQITEYADEPSWIQISHLYRKLEDATCALHNDLILYKNALSELDSAGISINNGKERIFLIREQIAQIEGKQ
jgi:hypothetical protein